MDTDAAPAIPARKPTISTASRPALAPNDFATLSIFHEARVRATRSWHGGSYRLIVVENRSVEMIANPFEARTQSADGYLVLPAGLEFLGGILGTTPEPPRLPRRETFANPVISVPSADPWVIGHDGFYYYCESRNQTTLYIRKAKSLHEIGQDPGVCVWTAPAQGMNSSELWAPELHFINGKWYIYYAADDGDNENHRMWVLESLTSDPQGPYLDRGCLDTEAWAIDGTILQTGDGSLYFIWSGWAGKNNGRQNLYIAPMSDPVTVSGRRTMICTPTEEWETADMAIAEGPQVLQQDGRIFIVYSASGSWTVDYCLGLLEFTGGDVTDPRAWIKRGPVFQKTRSVWGVGHCSFVQSPDRSEDWIVYHAKTKQKKGWCDRNVRMQRFSWNPDGSPDFGAPVDTGVPIFVPSNKARGQEARPDEDVTFSR